MTFLFALLVLLASEPPVAPLAPLPLPAPRTLIAPAELATRLPTGGIRFATLTLHDSRYGPQALLIGTLDQAGVHLVSQTPVDAYSTSLRWLDAHTLFLATSDDVSKTTRVTRFVDGVAAETITVAANDWRLADGEEAPTTIEFMLSGDTAAIAQRWLGGCVLPLVGEPGCETMRYLRIDASPFGVSRKPPRARKQDKDRGLASLPSARPPPGVHVKLGKRQGALGFTCTSPTGNSEWPEGYGDFQTLPKKLRWVHDKPAIFVIEGPHVWPMGERTTERAAFMACEPEPMIDFRWLGQGIWARAEVITDDGQAIMQPLWRIYLDDVLIAEVPGNRRGDFAVAPR